MRSFTLLPPPELPLEAMRSQVVRRVTACTKGLVGGHVVNKRSACESIARSIEAHMQSMCPGILAGRHFTVNIHLPKSRKKRKAGFVKIVVRPLPRSARSITYSPTYPADHIEVSCTINRN